MNKFKGFMTTIPHTKPSRPIKRDASTDLAVGDDGADDHGLGGVRGGGGGSGSGASDNGRLAKDDLDLPGRAAALRRGLDVGGRGPGERAPALEEARRAEARGALAARCAGGQSQLRSTAQPRAGHCPPAAACGVTTAGTLKPSTRLTL